MRPPGRREFLQSLAAAGALETRLSAQRARLRPNILFILADDLGYGDLGCYGQRRMETPNLDRLAAEGMRFTQFYAGSTVCAPSRCCLMTGFHTGHARVRGNGKLTTDDERQRMALHHSDVTVASLLKRARYRTGLIGKWGLGEEGTPGIPNQQGFDEFFGYLNQTHAHNYYPDFLWRNQEKVPLHRQYSNDLFNERAVEFLGRDKNRPFFLYLAYTLPHANNELFRATGNGNEVPTDAPYTDKNWSQPNKNFAAMVTRLDSGAGAIFDALKEHGLEENTLVIFSSDNGPQKEGGNDPAFFDSTSRLRGIKRDLYEGGIRVPMIVRWPGKVKAGSTSEHIGAFWDFLPTAGRLAGVQPPSGIDGVSFLPELIGGRQPKHEYLYWEFYERGFSQAVRLGDWKAVRERLDAPVELYDLETDPGEQRNVAAEHPDVVRRVAEIMRAAHAGSADWPVRGATP